MSSQYRFRNVIVTTNITSNGIFRSNYRLLSDIVVTYIFKYNETNGDLYINVSTDKIKKLPRLPLPIRTLYRKPKMAVLQIYFELD